MIDDPGSNVGGGQQPNDPYSTAGMRDALMLEITNLILEIKKHPGDMTSEMNKIFGDMQKIQGLLVGQSSETQSGLTTAITGIANLQKFGASKGGAPVQDINIFTGQPQDNPNGTPRKVSPECAFRDECMFLLNSPNTRDKLTKDGKRIPAIGADGKPIMKNGKPTYVENSLYKFTHTKGNESVAAQLKSAVIGSVTSLSDGTDHNAQVQNPDDTGGYQLDANGQVETWDTGYPKDTNYINPAINGATQSGGKWPTDGCIANMWNKANPPASTSGTPPTPNSSILNSFQSAMGTLGQAGTASSSTLQAYIKVLTDNLTASQGNYNKALTATISQLKVMVQAQKTGG